MRMTLHQKCLSSEASQLPEGVTHETRVESLDHLTMISSGWVATPKCFIWSTQMAWYLVGCSDVPQLWKCYTWLSIQLPTANCSATESESDQKAMEAARRRAFESLEQWWKDEEIMIMIFLCMIIWHLNIKQC